MNATTETRRAAAPCLRLDKRGDMIALLGQVYLEAGLPPEAAWRSAAADFGSLFEEDIVLCAS